MLIDFYVMKTVKVLGTGVSDHSIFPILVCKINGGQVAGIGYLQTVSVYSELYYV